MKIEEIVSMQKAFFEQNGNQTYQFRVAQLSKLYTAILKFEESLYEAFEKDLKKSKLEVYETEIGFVLNSIRETNKNLRRWMKPKKTKNPLFLFGSKSYVISEPYGVMSIIGPFNYPFQLTIEPLVGAIAAGNTAIIKPSELTPNVSRVIKNMIEDAFEGNYVKVVEGSIDETTTLLAQPVDYIFFTGSPRVGKIVMEAAAENLTPLTLELGGKSPAIVTENANLKDAVSQIAWGKFLNTGQTCVAPDYVMIDAKIKGEFITLLKEQVNIFYGEHPEKNPDYGRMATVKHAERMKLLMEKTDGDIVYGGIVDEKLRYVAPTIIDNVSWQDPLMQDEIFGPLLPVLTYNSKNFEEEIVSAINKREKPLALYLFTNNLEIKNKILKKVYFGGGVVNGTLVHLSNTNLPFGGVGQSGLGHYHGKNSFTEFTHQKSIVEKNKLVKLNILYPPYNKNKMNLIKKIMR